MLDKIKSKLFSFYDKNDKIGLFFSLYDENNNLLVSNGTLFTDKNMDELVEILYHAIVEKEKKTQIIAIDVVKEIQMKVDVTKFMSLSPKEFGVLAINKETQKSGIILPNIEGVDTMEVALALMKQKHGLSGNVEISTFTTRRVAFTI